MYYQNYEDYMRSVLGYNVEPTYENYLVQDRNCNGNYQQNSELEDMYPEIYKIINPIVCEVCDKCNTHITRDVLENMVEEVYQKIELNNEIWIKIEVENRTTEKQQVENRNNTAKPNISKNVTNEPIRKVAEVENRQRRPNNPLLRDLIRILILNRLLGRFFPRRPQRPPFPGPGRFPFV